MALTKSDGSVVAPGAVVPAAVVMDAFVDAFVGAAVGAAVVGARHMHTSPSLAAGVHVTTEAFMMVQAVLRQLCCSFDPA